MNNDLIGREALKDLLNEYNKHFTTFTDIQTQIILDLIDHAPTVDMNTELSVAYLKGRRQGQSEERPQGEWIIVTDKYGKNVKCPFCGKEIAGSDLNYCVKCGAKMKGGAK